MPSRMQIIPNAGMLYPSVQEREIGGAAVRLLELRVRDIARLESAFSEEVGHPLAGIDRAIHILRNRSQYARDEIIQAGLDVSERSEEWPPPFDSQTFREVSASDFGRIHFLGVMLCRTNRGMTERKVARIASRMTPECWETLDRIAWGFAPWMAFSGDEDDDPEMGPGRGIRWGREIDRIARNGVSYREIGRMFVNQFINARAGGEPWTVWIRDQDPSSLPRP